MAGSPASRAKEIQGVQGFGALNPEPRVDSADLNCWMERGA